MVLLPDIIIKLSFVYYMKILLTPTQSPGNGGAPTNLYKLNKYLFDK